MSTTNTGTERTPSTATEQSPRARMHHYLPISYLKRFTDAQGFLHVLDFEDQKTFKSKPQNVAKIRDFYTVETIENAESDELEQFLSLIESKARPVFEQIIAESRIQRDSEAWGIACNFIALLDCRLPISRDFVQQSTDHMMNVFVESEFGTKERMEATLKCIEADTGQKPDLDFDSVRQLIDDGCVSAEVPQNWQIQMMLESASRLVPLIWKMTPQLLIAEDVDFITGDCPLAKQNRQPIGPFSGIGWLMPQLEVLLPIGRRHCIVLTWEPQPPVRKADRQVVATCNCKIAQWSTRFVFGSRERFVWMDRDGSIRTDPETLIRRLRGSKANRQLIETWPPLPGTKKRRTASKKSATRTKKKPTRKTRKRRGST